MLRRIGGCGLGIVLAVVVIVSLVGWVLSFLGQPTTFEDLQPVPKNMPPAPGAEVPAIDVNTGGRTAEKLTYWAEELSAQTEIEPQALRAYGNAELVARERFPNCNLRWNSIAGLAYVETRHGTYNGNRLKPSKLDEFGYPAPPITGIALDGTNNTAEIPDTDNGEIDGDPEHDRAVGPMQFLPQSWAQVGADANGDGVADPNHIDDAAVGAAALLCFGDRDLSTEDGWKNAVLNYNQSLDYLHKVQSAANSYSIPQRATS